MTQREKIEKEKEEYVKKSGVKEVNIIVPNKVVEVVFDNTSASMKFLALYCINPFKDRIKTVCDDEDEFSLERALYIAFAKQEYGYAYTHEGIEKKADEYTYMKSYIRKVKNAMKVYECQKKLENLDKEEKEIKYRQHKKRMEQKARRLERRAAERKNEQIAIQKEAYIQAMKELNQ